MGKRKKRAIGGKHFIIISSIIALNAMGLSYAYWTDQLNIITSLTMGSMDPIFCESFDPQVTLVRDDSPGQRNGNNSGKGNEDNSSDVTEEWSFEFPDDHTMVITGQIEEGYKASINYCIVNAGTIPIKYSQSQGNDKGKGNGNGNGNGQGDLTIKNGLKIEVNQQREVLEPQDRFFAENGNGNPKVQIQVANEPGGHTLSNPDVPDRRTFELNLPFDQWTK